MLSIARFAAVPALSLAGAAQSANVHADRTGSASRTGSFAAPPLHPGMLRGVARARYL